MEKQAENKPRAQVLLPMRPTGEKSKSFRKVSLITNHYPIKISKPFQKIVIFSVRFTPKIMEDNRNLRQSLLEKILPEVKKTIENPVISGFNIYSLKQSQIKEKEYSVGEHKIIIKEVKVFDVGQNPHLLLVFLNNGLKRLMGKNKFQELGKIGGRYFDTSKYHSFDNLRLYDGYKANFVRLQKGIFLRVDSIKKVVRQNTVLQFINNFYIQHNGKDKQQIRQMIIQQLSNKIVMSNYATMRYYKVVNVAFKKGSEIDIGPGVNMFAYFKQKYSITLKNQNQPLLEVQMKMKNTTNPTYLFPQLCLMTGIPDDFDEMRRKKVSEATILNPPQKHASIDALMSKLKSSRELDELRSLGIDLSKNMAEFQAKVIPVPRLLLGEKSKVDQGKQAFFNLFNKPIFSSKHDVCLGIISFKNTDIKSMISTFTSTSENLKVQLKIKNYQITGGRNAKDIINQFKNLSESVNICLIVLPNNMKNDYKKIKHESITNLHLLTQVVTEGTLRKKNLQSIATKILLQIVAKRGNTLWVPQQIDKLPNSMLLGFDYAKTGSRTYISACSTINSTYSSLYSKHDICQQSSDKFKTMKILALDCIKGYNDRNDAPPKQLLIFFNSCTSDQVITYHEQFFMPLVHELNQIFQNIEIGITGVMVNIKNSERFFINQKQVRNVQAGTLISSQIVSEYYDFFLVSQQSNKGSTVPNHYKVIFNTSKLEQGQLQELIFGQCFNYVNWTGSIKVPSVLQYAKKSAKFSSQVLEHSQVPKQLFGKPYFV